MKIICRKDILLNGINTVSRAVITKTPIPMLECILLKAETNGFRMMGNNLELAIESKLKDVDIIEEGSVAIEAKILSEIIRRLPEDNITILTDENNSVLIKCINSEYKIAGKAGDEFPDLPVIEKSVEYTLQQCKLKDMIRQTIFSISTDESKITFTGELLEIKNNALNLVSLDGYRVSFRTTPLEITDQDNFVIVPGKTLNDINKILSSEEEFEVSIYFTDKNVLFDLGDTTVVSRVIDGDFIKYEQVFDSNYTTEITVNRKDLMMCLDRAALLSRDNKKTPVKMEIEANKLIITSETDLGKAYEQLDITVNGNDMSIAFNPKYIIDALKAIDDEEIDMYFISSLSPCTIRPTEGNDYKYLVLPVRLNS